MPVECPRFKNIGHDQFWSFPTSVPLAFCPQVDKIQGVKPISKCLSIPCCSKAFHACNFFSQTAAAASVCEKQDKPTYNLC